MHRLGTATLLLLASVIFCRAQTRSPKTTEKRAQTKVATWHFAVAGDSRNCGDVIMPAIATAAAHDHVAFYWHLGDLRKISAPDQDFQQLSSLQGKSPSLQEYQKQAWQDFIEHQLKSFGSIAFLVGIGNHEMIPPQTRAQFLTEFAEWLNSPEIKAQRLKDDPKDDQTKTYYHWVRNGIDFINLDNASRDEFSPEQMKWFEAVLARDSADASIHSVIAGMHAAFPNSISADHSMNEWLTGKQTGEVVYLDLLRAQNEAHKNVYVLSSHSHYFMEGIFNTEYWRTHGGVLPGWIIGTAGAERYPLPPLAKDAKVAETNVYGYLLATVNPPGEPAGTVKFEFKRIEEDQIPGEVVRRFTEPFVKECFTDNRRTVGFMH